MNGFKDLIKFLGDSLNGKLICVNEALGELCIRIKPENLLTTIHFLKNSCKFLQLTDICGVDYPEKAERFCVIYHLINMHKNMRIRVSVSVPNHNSVPTITSIFQAANWYEREVYDMYGIMFEKHPNLDRILTDYNFDAFPMRKDFPTEGLKEVHFDENSHTVIYSDIDLPQANRTFEFINTPWSSPDYHSLKEDLHGKK